MTFERVDLSDLVLVRHGQSTWNELRLVQGQNDEARLTAKGRDQALRAANELRTERLDRIISSDLTRTRETAQIIADVLGLEIDLDADVRERSYGVAEGGSLDAITPEMVGVKDGVIVDEEASVEGGESLRALRERAGRFVGTSGERWPGERLLVVTHGGTIRALRSYCAGTPMQDSEWYAVANCTIWMVSRPTDDIAR
ncbi:MAG: histidine phosphatase family protein [Acidimicrobiales bacterium]